MYTTLVVCWIIFFILRPSSGQTAASAALGFQSTRIGRPYSLKSTLSKRIATHQSNCSIPSASYSMNHAGLGSDLHVWSQTLCHEMTEGYRLHPQGPWDWLDSNHCGASKTNSSTLGCYFPLDETHCRPHISYTAIHTKHLECSMFNNSASKGGYRAAATEYLFSKGLAPFVQEEIKKQMMDVFGQPFAPKNLITVHIRWGDKAREMELVEVEDYVKAVRTLLKKRQKPTPVHVYVATEDPRATASFRNAAPPTWSVYGDAMVNEMESVRPAEGNNALVSARKSHGFAGTVGLASLAISMEANEFVLTTRSNWSRLMNELRTNVIDPRCGGCTVMVDLRKGQWR